MNYFAPALFPRHLESWLDNDLKALTGTRSNSPAIDFIESEDDYQIVADLPGYNKEDLDVRVHNRVLHLKAKREDNKVSDDSAKLLLSERRVANVDRKISLPREVDADDVNAVLKDGVLTIHLAKMEASKPRQIAIS